MAGTDGGGRGVKRKLDISYNIDLDSVSLDPQPGYDASKESATRSVTTAKEWKSYVDLREQLHQLLKTPLNKTTYTDAYTNDLIALLEKDFRHREQEAIMVSVSGNMGGGKSALLNSLFQVSSGDIARSSGMGSSCTLASNIFTAPQRSQKDPFVAEVHFFSVTERREILASYLGDYYRALHSEDQDGPATQNDKETLNDIRHEVVTAFASLYIDEDECESEDKVRAFLDSAESDDDPRILDKLFRWADALVNGETKGKPTRTLAASTATMLLTELEKYTIASEDENGQAAFSLAPLVEVIYFHFDDPLLRMGISFLDTPGLQDSNRTRRRSAQKFRHKRTHALIVTGSDRAKSDDNVAREARAMSSHKSNRIVVVATKSDNIDAGSIPPGRASDKTQVERFQKDVKTLRFESSALDQQLSGAFSSNDYTLIGSLSVQRTKFEVLVKAAENREKAMRISMRADNIKSKIQSMVRDSTGKADSVSFYSVSNWDYQKHLQGYNSKEAPTLSVEETNIPALRELISTFPNEARLSELQHEQKNVFPALLMRLKIYTSRSATDRKADMERYVAAPLRQYEYMVDKSFDELWSQFHRTVVGPLIGSETIWNQKARKLCEEWAKKFNNTQFSGLLRYYGHRRARGKTTEVNLSADLMGIDNKELCDSLSRLVNSVNSLENDLEESVGRMATTMLEEMRGDDNAPFVKADPFYKYVCKQDPNIRFAIEEVREHLIERFDVIIRKVANANEDAYLVEAMRPIYEKIRAIKQQKGVPKPREGWPNYRKNRFAAEVSNLKGVRSQVCHGISVDLEKLVSEQKELLKPALKTVFEDIRSGFDMRCHAQESDDPGEKALRKELNHAIKQAKDHLNGPMQQVVNTLLRDFR